jgi:hypothetical protein
MSARCGPCTGGQRVASTLSRTWTGDLRSSTLLDITTCVCSTKSLSSTRFLYYTYSVRSRASLPSARCLRSATRKTWPDRPLFQEIPCSSPSLCATRWMRPPVPCVSPVPYGAAGVGLAKFPVSHRQPAWQQPPCTLITGTSPLSLPNKLHVIYGSSVLHGILQLGHMSGIRPLTGGHLDKIFALSRDAGRTLDSNRWQPSARWPSSSLLLYSSRSSWRGTSPQATCRLPPPVLCTPQFCVLRQTPGLHCIPIVCQELYSPVLCMPPFFLCHPNSR